MVKQVKYIVVSTALFLLVNALLGFRSAESPIGKQITDFSLKNVNGKMLSLSDYPEAKGCIVVFTCNHCPFAKLYPKRMNALSEKYAKAGVPLIAISSTDPVMYEDDSYEHMVEKAVNENFVFPYLFDERQVVARQFAAQKTPHAFVLWKEKDRWVVKYSGAIDDNGGNPAFVKEPYVANAVEALLNNREVTIKETKSIGCQIYFSK